MDINEKYQKALELVSNILTVIGDTPEDQAVKKLIAKFVESL